MKAPRLAGIIVALALVVPAWAFVAPSPIGRTVYSVVHGSSMHPLLTGGDLVVLRPAARYAVGDVVAYRSTSESALLLHRIVSVSDGRYTLKGDANGWLDTDTPSRSQIVGKMWFSVPRAGSLLAGPSLMLLLFALSALAAIGARTTRRRRGRPDAPGASEPSEAIDEPAEPSVAREGGRPAGDERAAALVTGVIGLIFLLLGASTFVFSTAMSRTLAYAHTGSFSYGAAVEPGAAYPDGSVDLGEPIFVRLVEHLDLRFVYEVRSSLAPVIDGTISLSARIRDEGSRWERTIPLRGPMRISGPDTIATAGIDLKALSRTVERFEESTGLKPPHYVVSIEAAVAAVGTLADVPVSMRFAASMPFMLNGLTLQPTLSLASGQDPATAPEFSVRGSGSVRATPRGGEATVFGARRAPMRAGSATGAAIFLTMTVGSVRRARRTSVRAPRRFKRLIVEARTPDAPPWRPAPVVVASMDDLAWIAEQGSRPILHERRANTEIFEVRDGDIVYRFEGSGAERAIV